MPLQFSVIVPLLNEDQNIFELHNRLTNVLKRMEVSYEIIFVDDGSKDHTLLSIENIASKDDCVKYISFSRNFGHQIALFAGLQKCKGEYIVLIDGDLQDPPEIIANLFLKIKQGYNVVYAKRINRKGETFVKKATAKIFYRILRKITAINIPVDTGDFRIMDRKVCNELLKMNDHRKFLRGQIAWLGFKETFITYEREERKNGSTNFTYRKMFSFAIDGITGFSSFPLKFASLIGIIVSFFAFLFIVYVLFAKLVWGQTITGWASMMITILFLGGVQLLSIGIIGEYISRINDSVRNRQPYIIDKSNIDEQ
ncbi:MAG: glycosyltransferase family 2 protein [Chitinophagaceae bacterium]|nr:glycosyltransferase family 2 protein [Chitinophagaceae bacterium]MCW5926685.1 glycosyltransferase family 2 protein [Chitinophagaceae bacterium]